MRHLQLRAPPSIINHHICFADELHLLSFEEPLAAPHGLPVFCELIMAPVKAWQHANTAFSRVHAAHKLAIFKVIDSSQDCKAPMLESLKAFPRASHLSHELPTHLDQYLLEARPKVFGNSSVSESSFEPFVFLSMPDALEQGKRFILSNLTNSRCNCA